MSDQNVIRLMDLGIKRLNSKGDFEVFESFITQELDLDAIYFMIDEKIKEEDGPILLEYILIAFSVKPDSQNIIEQLYSYVMNAINTTEIPEQIKVNLIKRLSLNLYNLSSDPLITFINMCKKDIDDANEKSMQSWKELMPQILKMISESKVLTVGGLEITGAEYKEKIITDICSKKIKRNIIAPVSFMLGRTLFTEKERDLVIKSLCVYFDEMKPQEIPYLLQQIIRFCKHENYMDVFRTLQKYFDDKYIVSCYNEENNTFPIEDAERKELLKAQSRVLFYLEDFAKCHSSFFDAITKYVKYSICAPNMVFGPFTFAFLLTLSSSASYKARSIILENKLITQLMLEVENTHSSFWLKMNRRNIIYDIYTEIQIFINSNITSNEKVLKGLVNLGLSLLDTTSIYIKNVNITNKIHQLGIFIIVTSVNKRSSIIENVLQTLTDFITCNPKLDQYIECLRLLCKNPKTSIVEQMIDFLKLFREISVGLSNKIISAIMPALKISNCLRDNVITVLRKELMSKDLQLKHDAILGFVEILCSISLEDSFTSLSQSTNNQDSWSRLFTQGRLNQKSIDTHGLADPDNTLNIKSYCLEILNILKVCFIQKSEIKKTLYRGLIRVMSHNSGLCVNINNSILNHMHSWCIRVTDNKKSLKFNNSIVEDVHKNLISHEPLEELIFLAQHISSKNIAYEHRRKCTDEVKILLGKLVNFYSECNMDEINVNENDSLLDVMSNISHYSDTVKQVLCVYQVFMVYVVNTWSSPVQDKECSEKLQNLFSKYNYIIEAIEASNKTIKKEDKEQKSETFKFIEPFMNLDFDDLYKFLSLLIKNVNWASDITIEPLKQNARLWEFVLKLVQTYLIEIESLTFLDIKPPNIYENLCKLSKLLYNHIFFDVSKNIQFSPAVMELGIECYLRVIKFVSSHYKKLDTFLLDSNQKTSTDGSEEIFSVLDIMRSDLDKVLEMNQVDESADEVQDKVIYDKIECDIIGCVSVMCNTINQNQDTKTDDILNWLSTVIENYSFSSLNNSKDFLTLLLDMHTAHQEDPIILAILVKKLSFLFGEINRFQSVNQIQQRSYKFITELNISMICIVLCRYLVNELKYVLLCLNQFKAEFNISQIKIKNTGKIPKSKESVICHRVILVLLKMISFTNTIIPMGHCTESVFKLLFNIYHTVNRITKYFLVCSSYEEPVYKGALLEKLSAIINSKLTPNVSKFIMFVANDGLLGNTDEEFVKLRTQSRPQSRYIPKVVAEIELFVTLITELGEKCKDENLINVTKLTFSRGFVLDVPIRQDSSSKKNNPEDSDSDLEEVTAGIQSSAFKTVDQSNKKPKFGGSSTSSSDSSRSTSPDF